MILPAPSFPAMIGESPERRVTRIVQTYDKCSLSNRFDDLAALIGRGIDTTEVATWPTDCATFALGVLFAAGVDFEPLRKPLVNGQAFSLLVQLGHTFAAWQPPSKVPTEGAVLWFRVQGQNRDHAEFCLENAVDVHNTLHGGAGRANNGVSIERGDIMTSQNRPLYLWLDASLLELPDAHVE